MCAPRSNVSGLHITLFQLCATAKSVTLTMLIDEKIYHFIDGYFTFFLPIFFFFIFAKSFPLKSTPKLLAN